MKKSKGAKKTKPKSKPRPPAKKKKRSAPVTVPMRALELATSNPGWIRAKAVRVVRDKLGRAVRLLVRR